MFEMIYREMRERRSTARLREIVPELIHLYLAPFLGPLAAGRFIEERVGAGPLPR